MTTPSLQTVNGLHRTEPVKPRGPWRTVDEVEYATAEYVDWFNNRRPHGYCGDMPPAQREELHYAHHQAQQIAGLSHQ